MPFANNQGIQIYYETVGQGNPLILIMGLGGTGDAWKLQVVEFSKKYKVITLDNRGAGKSDKPDTPYDMKQFASDVAAVMDAEKIEKAAVIGLSMGGLIAQEFYHSYPQKVDSLVLGCTGVGAGDPAFIYPTFVVSSILNLKKGQFDDYELTKSRAGIFYHPDYMAKIPHFIERLMEMSAKNPQPEYAYQRQLEACMLKEGQFNSPRLKNIKVPVLVMHGEDDRIWPLENAQYLAKNIQGAQLEIMKDCAHMFFLEKYEEFNKKVLNFMHSYAFKKK